jgi:ligand-binding SRPBCC domain-containing protein
MLDRTREPFTLRRSILVQSPIERCFLLSTSLAIVQKELRMKPVAGRTSGLATAGDTIRWEGWQLGFWNFHVSRIPPETFDPPRFFEDRMIAGRFRSFAHSHRFEQTPEGVLLHDELRFTMPFGLAGWIVGRLIMVPHIRGLLRRRFHLLKRIAESDEWRRYLAV